MTTRIAVGAVAAFLASASLAHAGINSRMCEIAWAWGGVFSWFGVFSGC
jgi:hypothetical protein